MALLHAGAATSNITPPLGTHLAGSFHPMPAESVHDELHARALVLEDGGTRIAIVVCDLIALDREVIDPARRRIEQRTGIPRSHILIAATHTHSGPCPVPKFHYRNPVVDISYLPFVTRRIADAVEMAARRVQPARVAWGVGSEPRQVFNRRWYLRPGTIAADPFGATADTVKMNPGVGSPNLIEPAGPTDPDVSVLAVETVAGRPLAAVVSYALHYVGGTVRAAISADYFAVVAAQLARLSGADPSFVGMLANGCSGDINNINWRGTETKDVPYARMRRVAETVAAEAYRTWRAAEFHDTVRLSASEEELSLGVRKPSPEQLKAARQRVTALGPSDAPRDLPEYYAHSNIMLAERFPDYVQAPAQVLRVGDLGIATFPGEAFCAMGVEVKQQSPFAATMMIGLANDYHGYIPTVRGHEQGGYETWRATTAYLERDAAPQLVASAVRQLRDMAG
ncbi:MAG: hypothetical protein IPM24_13700 [Bryobacterales bacterium]|nr:hypothetical protein [Bryobacterales bacterium]